MTRSHLALVGGLLALAVAGALATVALLAAPRQSAVADLPAPPPVLAAVAVPTPAAIDAPPIAPTPGATPTRPTRSAGKRARARSRAGAPARAQAAPSSAATAAPPVTSFYPVYDVAQRTFAVSWLLLASIHQQETALSTDPTTYRGRNSAGCCAGPMQINLTTGPISTWERYRAAYRTASRPAIYGHRTRRHPSVYDDFDSVMAAAALLRDSGATTGLGAEAWRAAYDYYGHDLDGVGYASRVLARAIGWAQRGFCAGCGTDADLVAAVEAAYAAPVRGRYALAARKVR